MNYERHVGWYYIETPTFLCSIFFFLPSKGDRSSALRSNKIKSTHEKQVNKNQK